MIYYIEMYENEAGTIRGQEQSRGCVIVPGGTIRSVGTHPLANSFRRNISAAEQVRCHTGLDQLAAIVAQLAQRQDDDRREWD